MGSFMKIIVITMYLCKKCIFIYQKKINYIRNNSIYNGTKIIKYIGINLTTLWSLE